jgi:hypothetical protein
MLANGTIPGVSKVIHEGEIAPRYIPPMATLAHPAVSRITISKHPSLDMLVA